MKNQLLFLILTGLLHSTHSLEAKALKTFNSVFIGATIGVGAGFTDSLVLELLCRREKKELDISSNGALVFLLYKLLPFLSVSKLAKNILDDDIELSQPLVDQCAWISYILTSFYRLRHYKIIHPRLDRFSW